MQLRTLSYATWLLVALALAGLAKPMFQAPRVVTHLLPDLSSRFSYFESLPLPKGSGLARLETRFTRSWTDLSSVTGAPAGYRCAPGTFVWPNGRGVDKYAKPLLAEITRRMSETGISIPARGTIVFAIDDAGYFQGVEITDYQGAPDGKPLLLDAFRGWSPGTPAGGCMVLWLDFKFS